MKRFIVLIVYVAPLFIYGQTLEIGLKGGGHASYLSGTYSYTEEDVTITLSPLINVKYTLGGVVRMNITSMVSIQSELLYSMRGARFNEEVEIRGQNLQFDGDLNLSYIELPLLFRISSTLPERGQYFYPRPGFTFNAYIGGLFGYKTDAKFKGDLEGELFGVPFVESFQNSVWDQFSDVDYGIVVGGGIEYGVETKLTVDIRYIHGMQNIGNDPQFNDNIRNRAVSMLIGVMF